MNKEILLLTDYRGLFYSSTTRKNGVDIDLIKKYFNQCGFELAVIPYADIDFREMNFVGKYIIYPSSEDENLLYKDYIEDLLLMLQEEGAVLMPDFLYFRAHHNKVLMEIIRDTHHSMSLLSTLRSKHFGTLEDFDKQQDSVKLPAVFKPSAGAGSSRVTLAHTKSDAYRFAKELSKSRYRGLLGIKDRMAPYVYKEYKPVSWNRHKFIVQDYIPNLSNDWKVLVLGNKYYVIQRDNRPNDFRASGSGLFSWPESGNDNLLSYAKSIFEDFSVPFMSLDIVYDGQQYYCVEFQFVSFGPVGMQRSPHYFFNDNGSWHITYEKPIFEREIAASVARHINKNILGKA